MHKIWTYTATAVGGFFTGALFVNLFRGAFVFILALLPLLALYEFASKYTELMEKRMEYSHEIALKELEFRLDAEKRGVEMTEEPQVPKAPN